MENYFNYFTDVEECYRRCRETPTLLSPLDWALLESWKEAGIPLEAVLIGVERSFKKFQKRPRRFRKVNSLAYCAQEVLRAAAEVQAPGGAAQQENGREAAPPFPIEDILAYFNRNAQAIEQAARLAREKALPVLEEDLAGIARALREIMTREGSELTEDLEELERHLTTLEEKLTALLTHASSVELLTGFRREVERGLMPYRRKMTGAQIESMERQFLKKRLFGHFQIPRLSLFYL